ncbi:hypothetical protein GCM10020220_065520 [Nonomuraea rubra]
MSFFSRTVSGESEGGAAGGCGGPDALQAVSAAVALASRAPPARQQGPAGELTRAHGLEPPGVTGLVGASVASYGQCPRSPSGDAPPFDRDEWRSFRALIRIGCQLSSLAERPDGGRARGEVRPAET